jgi:hypothetical protein
LQFLDLGLRFALSRIAGENVVKPSENKPVGRGAVFLSYANADRNIARDIARSLIDAGISVWFDSEIDAGKNFNEVHDQVIRSSDYVLVLNSKAAAESKGGQHELAQARVVRELSDRAITIIPVTLDQTPLPEALSGMQRVDFSGDVTRATTELVAKIGRASDIDFAMLKPLGFESLVGDLLTTIGFHIQQDFVFQGKKFDFLATLRLTDPFGLDSQEQWVIEVKDYRNRPGVAVIHQVLMDFHSLPQAIRPALIVSTQLTSAAREVLASAGERIRLIEGVELKRILLSHPQIARKYFSTEAA